MRAFKPSATPASRRSLTRRQFVKHGLTSGLAAPFLARCWAAPASSPGQGAISGEPTAEAVGQAVLSTGGNVIDAIVAAALAAAVAAPHQTGLGGYGGCLMVSIGARVRAIDFNSAAPRAMTKDVFRPDATGRVPGRINHQGWLAAGVPGVLAGIQLALDRFGTRKLGELAQPAIRIAREGRPLSASLAQTIKANTAALAQDSGSRKVYLRDGEPPAAGALFRNPALADMLETLARQNSVDAFYRGDIARRIAESFQRHGGMLTYEDLAGYAAREVDPLEIDWGDSPIYTVPLTAGGITPFEALEILNRMSWPQGLTEEESLFARIESLRWAWRDRLSLLGDPERADIPVARLLSPAYTAQSAETILRSVKSGKILAGETLRKEQGGTIHLSAVDVHGNLAALTLTHGDSFGAKVTVEELGLTLGHGMSRFEPEPEHPNAPGPGKRPLHNMCPTIVLGRDRPQVALGGRGGRKIPNAVFEVLLHYVALGKSIEEAMRAPRLHTEGGADLALEKSWPEPQVASCRRRGYRTTIAGSATVSAATFNPSNGECRALLR